MSVLALILGASMLREDSTRLQASVGRALKIDFSDAINFTLKKVCLDWCVDLVGRRGLWGGWAGLVCCATWT